MLNGVAAGAANARAAARSNVFLAATVIAAGRSYPVRVRNISQGGALIEGADLPQEGSAVVLRRGSLSTPADIAWRDPNQCGVRFSTSIEVAEWVRRIGHAGQEQVDTLVMLARRPMLSREPSDFYSSGDSICAISEDLSRTCDRLADDAKFVEGQREEFLQLDAIAQRLRQFLQDSGEAL